MVASYEELDELDQLLADMLDDQLSDPQRDRLAAIFRQDAAARGKYVSAIMLHAAAEAEFGSAAAFDMRIKDDMGLPITEQDDGLRESLCAPAQAARKPDPIRRARTTRRPLPISLIAGCAVVAALLAVMAFFTIPDWRSSYPEHTNGPPETPAVVARAGYSSHARWNNEVGGWQYGAPLVAGQELLLESGIVEIQFHHGAHILLEGPARFVVGGNNQARLDAGKLVAYVPAQAKGFTVQTRRFNVVDMGTEFAIEVSDIGDDEVHVFSGEVEIRPSEAQASSPSAPQRLSTGQGLRIGQSLADARVISAAAERFRHAVPFHEEDLDDYARLVLADKPVAYWWLRDPAGTRIAADLTGNHRGIYAGLSRVQTADITPPHVEASLVRRFNGSISRVEVKHSPRLNPQSFTIEAWVRCTALPTAHASILSSRDAPAERDVVDADGWNSRGYMLYALPEGEFSFWTGSGSTFDAINGSAKVETGEWTHVAATFQTTREGERGALVGLGRLYVNGVEAGRKEDMVYLPHLIDAHSLRIGAGACESTVPEFYFRGFIADVAVYDHVLSPERIAARSEKKRGNILPE